jgi:TonB-linked SusC/RagA family outer membrane protein
MMKRLPPHSRWLKWSMPGTMSILVMLLSSFYVHAADPTQEVTIVKQNAKVIEVLLEIEKQTGQKFFYSNDEVDTERKVSLRLKRVKLTTALDELFKNSSVRYSFSEQYIVLTAKTKEEASVKTNDSSMLSASTTSQIPQQSIERNDSAPAPEAVAFHVSGTVVDEKGQSLPGVNVVEKGTSNGAITDADGNFKLSVADGNAVLVLSFIGYENQEVSLNGRALLTISMVPGALTLSEVVVIGYGTEQRVLSTGSVGTVTAANIKDLPVPTIDGVLQGQTAGVQVVQNSGTPGGAMSVRIRGISSIDGSSQPLYVIDGIPVTTGDFAQVGYEGQGINALADLNPSDIESITVLKDAASASIYGARATNGVVNIVTKRGKEGRATLNFNVYQGIQEVSKTLDMLNSREWMEYRNDLTNSTVFTPEQMNNIAIDTDWQKEIFRKAPMSNYEFSTAGGNDKTQFYVGLGYFKQDGILIGTSFQRGNLRVNVDHRVSEKFKLGTSLGITLSATDRVESDQTLHGPLPNGISTPAIYPVYNDDGTYNQEGPYSNAVSIANEATNENFTFRTLGNIYGEYQIVKGLTFTSKWGLDFYNLREHAFEFNTVQGQKYNGLGFETYSNVLNFISNNLLNYQTSFDKHKIDILAGYSFEKRSYRSSFLRAQDYADENLEYANSAATIVSASADASDSGIRSYFGRANYNLSDKYIVSLSGRVDASSKFGQNNRNGFFPAASVAWRVGQESFVKDNISKMSELKIRASYGVTGNDDIPAFLFAELYGNNAYNGQPAIYPSNIPNPDLKWETTIQSNLGLDIGLFSNRISVTADFYNKHTKDLLLSRPIPGSSGFTSITENIGEVQNRGFEVSVNSQNLNGPLTWTTMVNFSANRNKVLKLYQGQPIDDLGRGGNRVMEGEPIGVFYSFKSLGVDPSTGDMVYADTNFDGEITTDDRVVVGNPHPKFIGGITNNFVYKGFDLNIFLQFSYGNDVFHGSRLYLESLQGGDNQLAAVTRRWQQPGDVTDIPRATSDAVKAAENKRVSSRFIEDGSYLRIKNVTLGYTLNLAKAERMRLKGLRVYFTTQNLYTFTNYTGLDPEVNYSGVGNQVIGTDFFTFPQARSYTLGLNLKF